MDIVRESCLPFSLLIPNPMVMNSSALKMAWVLMWKKVTFHIFMDSENIISPSCDRVDIATTFFASFSFHAVTPAIIDVIILVIIMIFCMDFIFVIFLNREIM